MKASRLVEVLALCLLLQGAWGCGYRLAGTGGSSVIPEHIEIIAVPPFENRTQRPEIEQRVTEEVARVLNNRGKYRVVAVPAGAHAVLEGAVTSYRKAPVQFTSTGRATRVEAVITVQAVLRDTAEDAVLWSQSGLIFKQQYDVPDTGEFFDEESLALDLLARDVADTLVTSIFEGF
jgi:outer membrane lipopolysaccharide assembly protein LptE/RlpB